MPSPITRVAIAGATGSLGSVITSELIKAGFQITALTRDASKAKLPAGVHAVSVNYDDIDSLKSALEGQDAVVSTLSLQGLQQQQKLVDAAIANGVQKIIPSEFGSDRSTPEAGALPVYKDKIDLENYIAKKTAGSSTTYTIITTGAFLDWGLERGFLINSKERKTNRYDGGDIPFSTTPLYLIGQAVAAVLRMPQETANREVKIHGAALTSDLLLRLVQKVVGKDGWQVEEYDTVERVEQAYASLKTDPGNFVAWGFPMIFRAAFGKGMLTDFSKHNDNALLGVQSLTDEELRQIVKTSVEKIL